MSLYYFMYKIAKEKAKTEEQRRLFGVALAMKRGKTKKTPGTPAAEIAENVSEKKLEECASK